MGSVFFHLAKAVLVLTLLAHAGSVQLIAAADARVPPAHRQEAAGEVAAQVPGGTAAQVPGGAALPVPDGPDGSDGEEAAPPAGGGEPEPAPPDAATRPDPEVGAPDATLPAGTAPLGEEPAPDPGPAALVPGLPLGEPVYSIPFTGREIVLTIDDGPSGLTRDFLALLEEEEVPAVFFWLTGNRNVSLAAEVVARGHQLGTHSVSHPRLPRLSPAVAADEILQSQAALAAAAGAPVLYFRPPYGEHNPFVLSTAAAHGMTTVLWNVDSRDWALADNPQQIVANVMEQVRPGAIILIHERPQTLDVLRDLIRRLKEEGYTFVPLPPPSPTGK